MRKKLSIWSKMIIVLCCLAVVFTMVFFLREWYPVAKFREFLVETVNTVLYHSNSKRYDSPGEKIVESEDFTRIEEDVPFNVPRPGWLPEGYELEYTDYAYAGNDIYNINYEFVNTEGELIGFYIATHAIVDPNSYFIDYEWVDIGEVKGILSGSSEGESIIRLEYMYNQDLHMMVIGSDLNPDALIRIAESME